ncbi:MAG: HNH endonuclease [Chloroflexi bacterium]|nr:HNH endonuclease [Chloroflexota bacterium]
MVNSEVLVLNQNYEPLNVCNARRAVVLLDRGKAEVLEHGEGAIKTPSFSLPLPSVIRLIYLIRRPRPQRRLTRREIFLRDRYTCQYCGKQTRDLTIDHVVPRHRGGKHSWDNLVSACPACNRRKAGHTPAEAHMRLLHPPQAPRYASYYVCHRHAESKDNWLKFIPEWERLEHHTVRYAGE